MRVVIAEDDPISRALLETTLRRWGYEVAVACNGQEAFQTLRAPDAPRLAILDWMMPEMNGPDVCQALRQSEGGEYYYLILLTARGTKEDTVSGLEAGADDYVIKPFNMRELQVRVRCGERIVKLQSDLLAAQDALKIQATHDALTGLMNRAAVYDALEREQSRLARQGGCLSVVMLDLDHFKSINDTFGHAAGDAVLQDIAKRLDHASRSYDLVGRVGGEEFLLVMPNAPLSSAVEIAERIRHVIADTPVNIGARTLNVTASLGVASAVVPDERVSMDELVQAADDALYRVKGSGRNRVEAADSATSQA
ncbi:MAG: diguanylate cyclase [Phycisphaerae bacterium]|nr:diguanylate cyclase [Phycisphaerae bacterium]